jgi:hypothetical protein
MEPIIIVSVIGGLFAILSGIISFVLGARSEKRKTKLQVMAQYIDPIIEWINVAEKLKNMFGDTYNSIMIGAPIPLTYSLEDRRKSAQFMAESKNRIIGILSSKVLHTKSTKLLVEQLETKIIEIDKRLNQELLPMDLKLTEAENKEQALASFVVEGCDLMLILDKLIQDAYSLSTQIKINLV